MAGIDKGALRLASAFLRQRKYFVRESGASSADYDLTKGVVQGSALGPCLWSIYIQPVIDVCGDRAVCYADDVHLLTVCSDDLSENEDPMLKSVREYCSALGLELDPAKERFVDLNKKTVSDAPPIHSGGVLIDDKLSMAAHIDYRLAAARLYLVRLRRLRPFFTPAKMAALYKLFMWGRLEYGSASYAHASEAQLRRLDDFQASAARAIGIDGQPLLTLKLRREVAYMSMLYKQIVQRRGPRALSEAFQLDRSEPARTTRSSARKHQYTLEIPLLQSDSSIYRNWIRMLQLWNRLPVELFRDSPTLQAFKSNVTALLRAKGER